MFAAVRWSKEISDYRWCWIQNGWRAIVRTGLLPHSFLLSVVVAAAAGTIEQPAQLFSRTPCGHHHGVVDVAVPVLSLLYIRPTFRHGRHRQPRKWITTARVHVPAAGVRATRHTPHHTGPISHNDDTRSVDDEGVAHIPAEIISPHPGRPTIRDVIIVWG